LGSSGSGKSTILRIIAGLETAESGKVFWKNKDISGLPPYERHFGLMFQDYALFPHMSVWENVAFGLKMQNLPQDVIDTSVKEALLLVNMLDFANRQVTDLSGGEQQRVALARALAPRPQLLMLDEPLGALDRTLRQKLGSDLHALLRSMKIPAIYVTHDQEEAFAISDRLLVLHQGKILQSGKPQEVYTHPATPWLASFFGMDNQVNGVVQKVTPPIVSTDVGEFSCSSSQVGFMIGDPVTLVFKPAGANLADGSGGSNLLKGRVFESVFNADRFKTQVELGGNYSFEFILDAELTVGRKITLSVPPEAILCFRRDV
jgi:ABC-type Fe3+/spermidine/putrescine transport system ATPase subunit